MSFSDRAILWLHVVAAVFAIGPGTAAIMATPRSIRKHDMVVLRYLCRTTEIYAVASVLVLIFGLIAAQLLHDFSKPWISASITLYVVAAVLLVLIIRDQRKAMTALAAAQAPADTTDRSGNPDEDRTEGAPAGGGKPGSADADAAAEAGLKTAAVERGRIAMMSGIVALIWLAILVMMVWGGTSN
jgi:Ca2+/Na+ antiporter